MLIVPPKLVNVKTLEKEQQWNITVPSNQSLEWCVVLSYLKSSHMKKGNDFMKRIKSLVIDDSKVSVKKVKNSIKKYNPFLNEYSVYFDDNLKAVVLEFERKLNMAYAARENKDKKKIDMVCSLIDCDIVIFHFNQQDLCTEKCRIQMNRLKKTKCLPNLNLISNIDDTSSFYSFFLDEKKCFELQMQAAHFILKRTDLENKNINRLCKLIRHHNKSEHFIIYLLKSDLRNFVHEIYRYPYITHRLIKAGFEIDPRVQDKEGYSAFSNVLLSKDNQLVYTLFIYVANNFYKSKNTYRDPDALIISNLFDLEKLITNEYEKITVVEKQTKLYELIQFNKFLTEVCQNLLKIETQINYSDKISEKDFIARRQLEKISCILESYNNNFWINDIQQICGKFLFESFIKHKFYYDVLDISAALIFFDNIYKMKKRIFRNHTKFYFKLEEDFFLHVLSHKYLSNNKNAKKVKYVDFADSSFLTKVQEESDKIPHSFFVGILVRFNLRENIEKFREELRTELQCELDIPVGGIPRKSGYWPVIKDEFMMCRVRHFANIAVKVKVKNIKSVLIIERALQVLGEALKFDVQSIETFSYLLCCAIPTKIATSVNELRNELSHLDRDKAANKFEIEKNFVLFRAIQTELKNIMNALNVVFDIQKVRLLGFLKNNWKKFLEDWKAKDTKNYEDKQLSSIILNVEKYLDEKESSLDVDIKDYRILLKNICKEITPDITPQHLRKACFGLEHVVHFLKDNCKERLFEGIPTILNPDSNKQRKINKCSILEGGVKLVEFVEEELTKLPKLENSTNFTFEQDIKCENINKYKIALSVETEKLASKEISGSEHQLNSSSHETKEPFELIPVPEKESAIFESAAAEKVTFSKIRGKLNSSDTPSYFLTFDFFQSSLSETEELKPKKTISVNNATNLFNRIQHMETILLESSEIKELWEKGKSKDSQNHLIYKIAHRYLSEPDFQASIEMLLFDFIAILHQVIDKNLKEKKRKKFSKQTTKYNDIGLRDLWNKGRKLYTGINMRNVLAHGDFLLEATSDLLDSDDFPSELAIKLVQLMRDKEAVQAMGCLWQNVNGDKNHFIQIMQDEYAECSEEQKDLRLRIQNCQRWNSYYSILLKDC